MKRVQWLRSATGRGEDGAVLQQGLCSAASRIHVLPFKNTEKGTSNQRTPYIVLRRCSPFQPLCFVDGKRGWQGRNAPKLLLGDGMTLRFCGSGCGSGNVRGPLLTFPMIVTFFIYNIFSVLKINKMGLAVTPWGKLRRTVAIYPKGYPICFLY